MNLSLRQIQYVCTVAKHGSIQTASRTLRISPSSILAAIQAAEDGLGARIFDRRRSQGVQITPEGERFVAAGRNLLAAESDFHRQIGQLQTTPQSVRIGCFEPFGSLFMTEGLRRFMKAHGRIDVALFEGDQTQLADWLNRGIVDFAVSYDIGPRFSANVTRICQVPPHVLLPVDHPLARAEALRIVDLLAFPLVLLDLPLTVSYLLSLFDDCGAQPVISFRSRSYETVRNAVAAGFGITILNMRPIGGFAADSAGLVRVPLRDGHAAPVLQVADLYGAMRPRVIQLLIDTLVRLFSDGDPDRFAVVTPERRSQLFVV